MSLSFSHLPVLTTKENAIDAIEHFFTCFSSREARRLMHKMLRAALAKKDLLDKKTCWTCCT